MKYLMYISKNYSFAILRPIQAEILKRKQHVVWFVASNDVDVDFFNEDETVLTTMDDVFNYHPDAILYPSNIAPTFLPGINVAIFHGFDAGKVDKRGNNDHFKIRNCFDLYCTQGPIYTKQFHLLSESKNHHFITETGWSALDPLFNYSQESEKSERPTILLCSTFTKHLSCADSLFSTVKKLSETGRWNWIVQFHPKIAKETVTKYKSIQGEFLSFVETDNVIPLLQQADVMVCDTSSVLLMFLLLEKPVVTFKNIDPKGYLLDIQAPENLEDTIEQALTYPANLMSNIKTFIKGTHPYTDGNSSSRVVDAIESAVTKKDELSQKPKDIIRQFKQRKKLKYWKGLF